MKIAPKSLPNDWQWVRLEELLGDKPCNGLYKSSDFLGKGVLFLDINGLYRGLTTDFSKARRVEVTEDEYKQYELIKGDILFNRVSKMPEGVGKAVVVDVIEERAVYESNMIRVRVNKQRADALFIVYYLSTNQSRQELLSKANISNQASVNQQAIKSLKIPLPPLEEQRRIAAILDKADAVRRKRQSAIALTEELLRSAFLEMFGDPVTNPKGWEIVKLEQVCHRVTDGTHQSPEWAVEGIPFLFVSNIINGEIDFNVSKYISEESWASLTARCPIEVNDILYTTVGSYGNAALVRTKKRFCFQRHIAHIKPNVDKIHPEFFLGLMQSDGVKQQADRQVRGVAQKTLNLRELKNFQFALPPRVYQEQYVALRKNVEGCLNNQQNCFNTQDHLFNSLLQRAFRGEL